MAIAWVWTLCRSAHVQKCLKGVLPRCSYFSTSVAQSGVKALEEQRTCRLVQLDDLKFMSACNHSNALQGCQHAQHLLHHLHRVCLPGELWVCHVCPAAPLPACQCTMTGCLLSHTSPSTSFRDKVMVPCVVHCPSLPSFYSNAHMHDCLSPM